MTGQKKALTRHMNTLIARAAPADPVALTLLYCCYEAVSMS